MSIHKISLKEDWDIQPHLNEQIGHHIIRKKEHGHLVDFLLRKREGSLLISGKRGVGKTSSIFLAIQEINKTSKQKIIPLHIIASTFDLFEQNTKPSYDSYQSKIEIIKTLIRRLYKPNKKIQDEDNTLSKEIEELYNKAVAKEVVQEIKQEKLNYIEKTEEKTSTLNIDLKHLTWIILSLIGSGILVSLPIGLEIVQNILAILAPGVVSLKIISIWNKSKKKLDIHSIQDKNYYKYDYNLSNLQSDLEEVLKKLSKNNKVIFIIDELDKMSDQHVTEVIRSLKTLVTHGYAIFIFVTGDEFYDKLRTNSKSRESEYTLFTHKIFLQRPLFSDLEKFIDGIIQGPSISELTKDVSYDNFKKYLCYASKSDFFDLYGIIRDKITEYSNGPQLSIILTEQEIVLSKLQRAMEPIYLRKMYVNPANWRKNDALLNKLYDLLSVLDKLGPSARFSLVDDNTSLILRTSIDELKISDKVESSAVKNLIDYLSRLGYLQQVSGNDFEVVGTISHDSPYPTNLLTTEEKEFVNVGDELGILTVILANLYLRTVVDSSSEEFNNFLSQRNEIFEILVNFNLNLKGHLPALQIYENIKTSQSELHPREKLDSYKQQIESVFNNYNDHFYNLFIKILEGKLNAFLSVNEFSGLEQLYSICDYKEAITTPLSYPLFSVASSQIGENERKIIVIQDHQSEGLDFFRKKHIPNIMFVVLLSDAKNIKTVLTDPQNPEKYRNEINQFRSEILDTRYCESERITPTLYVSEMYDIDSMLDIMNLISDWVK